MGQSQGTPRLPPPRLWLTAALQGPGVPWADRAHTWQSPSWKKGGIGTRAPLALHCLAMPALALQPQTFSHVCVCVYMYVCVCVYILVAQTVKNLPAMQDTQFQSLGQEDPLEKGMATYSRILAWRVPWTEEPGGLQPMGSQSRNPLSTHTPHSLRLPGTFSSEGRAGRGPWVSSYPTPFFCSARRNSKRSLSAWLPSAVSVSGWDLLSGGAV